MATEDTQADVIRAAMDARIADVHTALPAQVMSYDQTKQTCDVRIMVKDFAPDDEGNLHDRSFPVVPSVAVAWERAGGYFLTMPLAEGDTGMLIFSELPIDRWRSTDQESSAVNARRHGIGNAVFYPGLSARGRALAAPCVGDHLALGKEGGAQIHIDPNMVNLSEQTAADFVALAAKVDAQFTALANAFAAWVVVPQDGGAALFTILQALAATWPTSTAATKVKAT